MRTKTNYRSIWEKHNGRTIPKDWHIHHVDGDSHNNDISNLYACHFTDHAKIHADKEEPWIANWILGRGEYDMSGENHPMWGVSRPDLADMNRKINYMKGVTGPDHYNYGKTRTDEWKKERSELYTGKNNPAAKDEVLHLINNNGDTLSSTRIELKRDHGFNPCCLTDLIMGRQKTHKGWRLFNAQS